jgi:shikimate dehydrogenase
MAGLDAAGVQVAGCRVLLAGAGGVARAIAFSLVRAGATELVIVNRSRDRADDLAVAVGAEGSGARVLGAAPGDCPPPEGFDLAINGTALGMRPDDPLPFDPSRLTPATVVAEVVMRPEVTALMQAAQDRGCRVVGGAAMMAPQADLVARFLSLAR